MLSTGPRRQDFAPREVLDDLQPLGQNALGHALRATTEDLVEPGPHDLVVVILDGLDTCGHDVAAAAETLTRGGEGANLHIFGLGLSTIEKFQASSWARFRASETASDLAANLQAVVSSFLDIAPPTTQQLTTISISLPAEAATRVETLSLDGPGMTEPVRIKPSPATQTHDLAPGSGTITAIDSNGDQIVQLTRIPIIPGRAIDLELPASSRADLEIDILPTGWGIPPEIEVRWKNFQDGPGRVVLSRQDVPPTSWLCSKRLVGPEGNLRLPLPDSPTSVEIQLRRLRAGMSEVVARIPFEAPGRRVSLSVPGECTPGSVLGVAWVGEAAPGDLLTLVPADTPLETFDNAVSAMDGSPAYLLVPPELCTYEVRYLSGTPLRVLAHSPTQAVAPRAGLLFQEEVAAGRPIDVRWWGPAGPQDMIAIAQPDSLANEYLVWKGLEEGSPVQLVAPPDPGDLEIRFVSQSEGILATGPLVVTEVLARLTLAETARAGSRLTVEWEGPAGPNDFLALVPAEQPLNQMQDFVYVSAGSPTSLAVPTRPGTYEVRYVAEAPRRELARATVEVHE